jgi:beta-phosphoglucomutase-like phosphatase (HAD superfamily)
MKAALLDVDGTLVASNDEHAQAWVRALAEFGYDADSIKKLRQRIFLDDYAPSLQPTPGARALLERLAELRILRIVSTSANREELG